MRSVQFYIYNEFDYFVGTSRLNLKKSELETIPSYYIIKSDNSLFHKPKRPGRGFIVQLKTPR